MRNLLLSPLTILGVAFYASGCSSDGAFADGLGWDETGGPENTAGGSDDGFGTEGGDGDSSDANDSGAGSDTGSGTTGGEDSGFDDPCDFVDCSSVGTCISDGVDTYCECPEGYLPSGDQCVPCPVLGDQTDLSIETFEVNASFKIDGSAPPTAIYEEAQFWLENRATGDRVDFGKSHQGELGARVLPGAYDLVYSYVSGSELPAHSHYVVQQVIVRTDLALDIDLPLITVNGDITLNGEPPPSVQYDDGEIFFVASEGDDEIYAGTSREGAYQVSLFPGEYELHYRVEDAGDLMPANEDAVVGSHSATLETEIHVAHVELTTAQFGGSFLINGAAPPPVQYDDGNLYLRTTNGDQVSLGSTRDQSYSAVALVGEYEVQYELEDGGSNVPANRRALVMPMTLAAGTSEGQNIDIPMISYSGGFTLNGGAAPVSQYDDATLRLRNATGEDEVFLGNTHDGSFAVGVIPGQYDLIYAVDTAGASMPVNVDSRLASVNLGADIDQPIDIPSVAISGSFTVDGGPPPTSEYEDGRLYLRKDEGHDAVLLGYTHDGGYQLNVVPGAYEVFFAHEFGTGAVPDNSNGLLMSLDVAAPQSFNVDVPVVPLAGSFTLDGAQAPSTYDDSGQLYLRRRSDGDSISLGPTHAGAYDVAVTPGTYEVFYARSENVATMPRNENARVTCFVVE